MDIANQLSGSDLRSIGKVNALVNSIKTHQQFDNLFKNMLSHERSIARRSADAVEKLTRQNRGWLRKHKTVLIDLIHNTRNKELKWHLVQLISRLELTDKEFYMLWDKLAYWLMNCNESRIVRVNSLQALFDLSRSNPTLDQALGNVVNSIRHENIPSLNARIKKLGL